MNLFIRAANSGCPCTRKMVERVSVEAYDTASELYEVEMGTKELEG